jgi:hypothetical protein
MSEMSDDSVNDFEDEFEDDIEEDEVGDENEEVVDEGRLDS